ncbi:MAG: hypothetical protein QM706_20425 [Nitrospira sp.]
MRKGAAVVNEKPKSTTAEPQEQEGESSIYRECALSDQSIFYAAEEVDYQGWFLRIQVTGMYPRRCGPFSTRQDAVGFLDHFISKALMNAFCELENQITVGQAYVVEAH